MTGFTYNRHNNPPPQILHMNKRLDQFVDQTSLHAGTF